MERVTSPRELVLLGSTGSIGTQAIDIVRRNPDRFRVVALGAGGGNVELLAAQALELGVEVVGVARASAAQDLQLAFYAEAQRRGYATGDFKHPEDRGRPGRDDRAGAVAVRRGAQRGGRHRSGSRRLWRHCAAGRTLALANKESLVAGGPLVRAAMHAAGADRAGGLGALGAGPVPARRGPRRRSGGWC